MSLNNVLARTDGALFSGPTFNNTIWTDLTATRDRGSPEWLPIYDDGQYVRFAARPEDLNRPEPAMEYAAGGVSAARVGPDRLVGSRSAVQQPDWLREKRATTCFPRPTGFRW